MLPPHVMYGLQAFLSWLDVIDDSQAHDSELDVWVEFIFEAAGKKRPAQLEHATVATCSEQFANLERQMRALMDGATELQEDHFLPLADIMRLKELARVDELVASVCPICW